VRIRVPFAVLAAVLLVVGTAALYAAATRTAISRYGVYVEAPDALSWTLHLPSPGITMEVERITGVLQDNGLVQTPFGSMVNVSGLGSAEITWVRRQTIYEFGPPTDRDIMELGMQLSARNESGFAVWRMTGDPDAELNVSGGTYSEISSFSGSATLGQDFYGGTLYEGWTTLPRGVGDGVTLIMDPSGESVAVVAFGLGTITAVLAVRGRRGAVQRPRV